MSDKIVRSSFDRAETIDSEDPAAPAMGKWYRIRDDDKEKSPWLGCIIHLGSNYAELKGVYGQTQRIHFNEFWDWCEFVDDPDPVIDGQIAMRNRRVHQLMEQVKEITARLAITAGPALPAGSETAALALHSSVPMDSYKTALTLAKETQLPDLFSKIRDENKELAKWMSAKLIPLQAQADALEPVIEKIKDRIFSVELYAGLVETVEQIADGTPADIGEKVHLLQRRCYMDEECLAEYETGGMEFKNLRAFEKWLCKPKNRDRILPFKRCIVAFKVRRNSKEREFANMGEFLRMVELDKLDKMTFLYIRNGTQVFRLQTEIEFGYDLFPDMTQDQLDGKMYARVKYSGKDVNLVSEGRYLEMLQEEEDHKKKVAKMPKGERWRHERHWSDLSDYHPFSPESVYYDDIVKHIHAEMTRHNRLVLVLQGLLDRSPVLHPHPAWSLWTAEGFRSALELIYDNSRSLVAGDKPDFEAYRAKLNASLKTGSITVGQEVAWEIREAERENARMDRDYRHRRSDYRPSRYRPHGNPGPGTIARVQWYQPKVQACTYKWLRKSQNYGYGNDTQTMESISVSASKLLNIDAYKPGDFKIFFADPRTRQEYLKWAPLLLEAEEYHAGNREVPPDPVKPPPKERDPEASYKYQQRKKRRAMIGKAVRLKSDLKTQGGTTYKKGSLWRITGCEQGKFNINGIKKDGTRDDGDNWRSVRQVSSYELEIDLSIPLPPKPKTEE